MASYQYKVANPTPMLAIVNGGKMAIRKTKKKTAAKRPRKTTAKNGAKKAAAKKRNPSTAVARRSTGAVKKTRKTTKKRTISFFRNPIGGDVGEGLKFGGAGIAISFGLKFTRPIINGFLGSSPLVNSGTTLATAYALAFGADLFSFTRPYGRYVKITGWTLFWTQIATTYVLPKLSGFGGQVAAPQQGMGWGRRRQMNGIGVWPGVPSGGGPAALPAARNITGAAATAPTMNGIGVWPGVPSGPR